MADWTSLARDLTSLEILLRAVLPGAAHGAGFALRLSPHEEQLCRALLPALGAAIGLLRRLGRDRSQGALAPDDAGLVTLAPLAPAALSDDKLRRRFHLTRREIDVLRLLIRGCSNAEVASALGISKHTARHHTERVLTKLNVHSRGQLIPALVGPPPLTIARHPKYTGTPSSTRPSPSAL